MKSTKITYWIITTLIFLFDGVLPALTFNSDLARQSIAHLGYPDYFRVELTVFKVIGAILLILPQVPRRLKDLAYAGFFFNFTCAFVAHAVVDGFSKGEPLVPLVAIALLGVSYICYHRLQDRKSIIVRPRVQGRPATV